VNINLHFHPIDYKKDKHKNLEQRKSIKNHTRKNFNLVNILNVKTNYTQKLVFEFLNKKFRKTINSMNQNLLIKDGDL